MKRAFALTLVGGLAAGTALAWFQPTGSASAGPSRRAGKGAAVRPAKLSSAGSSPLVKAWKEAATGQGGFGQRLALMAMVMRATSEEMPLLLAQSKDHPFAREVLVLRWVEIDAAAAADWITPALRDPNASGLEVNFQDVQRVLTAWAKRDPDAAMARVKTEAGGFTASMYQGQVIASVLADDMERGLKLMGEVNGQSGPPNRMYLDNSWVSKDPAKAARLLGEMPASDFRNDSLVRAIGELGAKDMAAGLALLEKFPGLSSRQEMWGYGGPDSRATLFENWAKQDMTAMIGFANDHAQGQTRSAMKEAIAKVIGEGDPKVAFAWAADNLSGQRRNNVVNSLLTKLAKENPADALEYLVSLPSGTALDNAVHSFARATTDVDPAAALARAQALPEGAARTQLLGTSYLAWYSKDPATAIGEIARQPADSLPKELWGNLGRASATIADGLKQLGQVPAGQAPEFVRGVFSSSATWNADMAQTAKSLEQLTDPAHRTQAIDAVMGTWAWRDPAAAVEWAAKLPGAEERQQVRTLLERRSGQLPAGELEKLLAPLK